MCKKMNVKSSRITFNLVNDMTSAGNYDGLDGAYFIYVYLDFFL